ncbi:MAG TPA: hypothetical protein VFA78_01640 [Chloroflexota bacterium]|nr:hypothetical protein [Chloroflexota bacterium]
MSENDLRRELDDLTRRLEGAREWPELRAIYLDIAPLIGRLGAVVREAERQVGTEGSNAARASLEEAKATARQVGLDIRLSSPAALSFGLQRTLDAIRETLDRLNFPLASHGEDV